MNLDSLVSTAGVRGASDIHLRVRQFPMLRINGVLERLPSFPIVTPEDLEESARELLTPDQLDRLNTRQEVDAALVFPGLGRCLRSGCHRG